MSTDSTDDGILDAAAALVDAGTGFSMAAVARRAGVSRGTVYRRFTDREALLQRLAERRGVALSAVSVDTRERLLDGVGQVLASAGPEGLTVDAVAAAADLGPATVYRHFDGRDALLVAFATERTPRRLAAMLDESPGDDIAGDLHRLAAVAVRFAREQPGLIRLMVSDSPAARHLQARVARGRRARDALFDYFSRQVEAGRLMGSPELMGLAFGALALAVAQSEATPPDEAARFAVQLFLDGLRPP